MFRLPIDSGKCSDRWGTTGRLLRSAHRDQRSVARERIRLQHDRVASRTEWRHDNIHLDESDKPGVSPANETVAGWPPMVAVTG